MLQESSSLVPRPHGGREREARRILTAPTCTLYTFTCMSTVVAELSHVGFGIWTIYASLTVSMATGGGGDPAAQ